MNELKIRGFVISLLIGGMVLIFISRLFFLQVVSTKYALKADQKDMREVILLPSRGIIFDRNDKIYVQNSPIYNVEFLPKKLQIPDTTILEEFLGLTREQIREKITKYRGLDRYHYQTLAKQVDTETYTRFSEKLWEFQGMNIEARNTRDYIYPVGANLLGYINQVSPRDLEKDTTEYYQANDLIGISGIERMYEDTLRGRKGKKVILVDAYNREVARYASGKQDKMPVEGKNLKIGIDAELQLLGEQLMKNKKGSVVAIEPNSGEILAFVSAPTYDPNLFTGGTIGKHYKRLANDTLKPLFNRPLMAQYPPGSIFKLLQALAAMGDGIIDENTYFPCSGMWFRNGGRPACHGAHGATGIPLGIKHSCNAFFAETYYSFITSPKFADHHASYQRWYDIMYSYGIGHKLGVDIPNEQPGNLPTKEYYDKVYLGKKGWGALTIYSNSIGQGEVLMTPMQMANIAAMIANRGWYITPHFVKGAYDAENNWSPMEFDTVQVAAKPEHFQMVVDAMEEVVNSGTATRARVDSIAVCGKTGTVENPPLEDHSVFIAFAPKDNPKIAIGVIVENAGFGGTWAAPIASLMIEKYLKGSIKNDFKLQRILDKDFIHTVVPKPVQMAVQ